ncbi:hypothetical protein MKO06_02215 [Gramella sp. GC03-9]|uniref:Uncharacterized protein n=1 Tax=Christiangramia oceanisediminis TaxID=2920386 RepID=A0A9X2KVH3_9FLAO|nr:hypothetical protein [Gramella oceanisediminis]MCP9198705.1 hypothetical protein [Gramella oceanisediminis]
MKLYTKLYEDFNEMYLGYAGLAIIASSCLGSIAAMLILMNGHGVANMLQLMAVVIVCMTFNAAVLAQLKTKFVFNSLIFSLLVSTIFIVVNLI